MIRCISLMLIIGLLMGCSRPQRIEGGSSTESQEVKGGPIELGGIILKEKYKEKQKQKKEREKAEEKVRF